MLICRPADFGRMTVWAPALMPSALCCQSCIRAAICGGAEHSAPGVSEHVHCRSALADRPFPFPTVGAIQSWTFISARQSKTRLLLLLSSELRLKLPFHCIKVKCRRLFRGKKTNWWRADRAYKLFLMNSCLIFLMNDSMVPNNLLIYIAQKRYNKSIAPKALYPGEKQRSHTT
jgi:hypothetical protein